MTLPEIKLDWEKEFDELIKYGEFGIPDIKDFIRKLLSEALEAQEKRIETLIKDNLDTCTDIACPNRKEHYYNNSPLKVILSKLKEV